MTPRQKVLADALQLPAADRAAIAGALLRSLDRGSEEDQDFVDAAWAEEIRRRLEELDRGTAETMSQEEARRISRAVPRTVRVLRGAAEEARAAWTWYRDRNPDAALAFIAEYDRVLERVAEAPERWPVHVHGTRRLTLRRFP